MRRSGRTRGARCNCPRFLAAPISRRPTGRPGSQRREGVTEMRKLWIVALGLLIAAAAAVKPSYVAVEKASSHVGFYDSEGKCLKEVKVGEHPHELVFSPDGRYVYTTDNGVLWMTEKADGNNTV